MSGNSYAEVWTALLFVDPHGDFLSDGAKIALLERPAAASSLPIQNVPSNARRAS